MPGKLPRIEEYFSLVFMQFCAHNRTEMLARRDGVDYVRCLDCDQVFEAEDLEPVPAYDEEDNRAA